MTYQINEKDKGYIHIYTGDGKGKTTAALGLAMRAVGAGLKVYIAQFIKEMKYSEVDVIEKRFPEIKVERFGIPAGCIYEREATQEDIAAAKAGLEKARGEMMSGNYDIVIMDELPLILYYKLVDEEEVLGLMDGKPEKVELVITGREATESMIERADVVTDMRMVKHYYERGITSRKGIEC